VTEVFVEGERDLPVTVSWLGGAIWRLQDDLSLDAALRLARSGARNTTEIRAGLTWEFGLGGSHDRNDLALRLARRR
jgi:hypothetical protein